MRNEKEKEGRRESRKDGRKKRREVKGEERKKAGGKEREKGKERRQVGRQYVTRKEGRKKVTVGDKAS